MCGIFAAIKELFTTERQREQRINDHVTDVNKAWNRNFIPDLPDSNRVRPHPTGVRIIGKFNEWKGVVCLKTSSASLFGTHADHSTQWVS